MKFGTAKFINRMSADERCWTQSGLEKSHNSFPMASDSQVEPTCAQVRTCCLERRQPIRAGEEGEGERGTHLRDTGGKRKNSTRTHAHAELTSFYQVIWNFS